MIHREDPRFIQVTSEVFQVESWNVMVIFTVVCHLRLLVSLPVNTPNPVLEAFSIYSIDFNSPQVRIAIGISAVFNSKLKSQKCFNMSDFPKLKNLLNSNRISESIFAPFTFHATAKFTNTVHSPFFTNTYAKVLPDLSVAFLLSFNFSMVT